MDMIPYVEIRSKDTRKIIGLIEGAKIFFEYNYNGCGDFEIYCRSTPNSLKLLKNGNYVTIPNEVDFIDDAGNKYCNIWKIKKVQRQYSRSNGKFLIATGQEAKCIVGQRIIRYVAVLNGSLTTSIQNKLFNPNIINPVDSNRKIDGFVFKPSTVSRTIVDDNGNPTSTQVTYDNLLDYTESLYATYDCGAKLRLNLSDLTLCYFIYEGSDKSESIVFSRGNDNLLSSDYSEDTTNYMSYALIGGEDDENGVRKVNSIDYGSSGIDRYELFVDAKDVSSKYQDENNEEQSMDDADYKALLKSKGFENLSEHVIERLFDGEIDPTNKRYKFNEHYSLGDLVGSKDTDIGNMAKVQVIKFTKVQDEKGYQEYFEHEVKEVK